MLVVDFSLNRKKDFSDPPQSTVSDDRLKRAIERNRQKQKRRGAISGVPEERLGRSRKTSGWKLPKTSPEFASSPAARRGARTRRSVATAENTEFTASLRNSPRKIPTEVNYMTPASSSVSVPARRVSTRSRSVVRPTSTRTWELEKKGKWQSLLVKAAWVFCCILVLRLIFSNGGAVDFYKKKSFLEDREYELRRIDGENQKVGKEIDKLKNGVQYQKKIIRDHLGFIAKDEYLILFAREKGKTSI